MFKMKDMVNNATNEIQEKMAENIYEHLVNGAELKTMDDLLNESEVIKQYAQRFRNDLQKAINSL